MVVGTAPCSGLLRRLRLDAACPVAASVLQRRHQQSTTSPLAAGQEVHKHAALFACSAVRPGHAASSSGSSGHPRGSGSPKQHGGSLLRHVASVSVPQTSTSQVLLPGTAARVRPSGQAPPPSLLDSVNRHAAAAAGAGARPKLRVAVDVDEVLGRFVYTLNQFCKDTYDMDYDVSDYWVYEFAKIWGCSQEHSNHIVHEFFQSQHFNDGIPVIPGAYEALLRLSETMELVVVTSRQHVIQDVTLEWLDRHYQGVFEEVYFGNHFALSGTSRKKSDICKTIGARVLIDDNPSYALECAAAGIHVLLYDWQLGYPWSKLNDSDVGPKSDLITVVRSWDDVEVALAALAPRLLAAPARARSSER